ncbi:MAG: UTP--glucose-1-phosphate uridylyltransferase [Chitinispirillaceae bacterium]
MADHSVNGNGVDKSCFFLEKMEKENLPKVAVDSFLHYYSLLSQGKTGCIPEGDLNPVESDEIEDIQDLERWSSAGRKALSRAVVIKLNGGLGTTMGLSRAKSLIPVKNGCSFLDITALQIRNLNSRFGISIPLILMNSFKTEQDSLEALSRYPDLKTDIPFSFLQHKFPKILRSDLMPATYPQNPQLEWNPPGHGDLYPAFLTSGILDQLIQKGYRYAFVSNADNLGATLDTGILGYFAEKRLSFLMEVTDRTYMDRKGGHLARLKNGKLILREAAQCHKEDLPSFRNIKRHRFFNTNNLWIDLVALKTVLEKKNNLLDLPMIRNKKRLDPRNSQSPEVLQLESAMGSAISVFENADAVRVTRSRFAPVKNCEELLLLWSDYYLLTEDCRITRNPCRKASRVNIDLDPEYYSIIDQLFERFPDGVPSLVECESLKIVGDVRFGKNVVVKGEVSINNSRSKPAYIPDNTHLSGDIIL